MLIVKHKDNAYLINGFDVTEMSISKGFKTAQYNGIRIIPADPHNLTWADVDCYMDQLKSSLDGLDFDYVTCPSGRGGLVPATILAYYFDIPFAPPGGDKSLVNKKVLLVDDIYDTGNTIINATNDLYMKTSELTVAVLVSRWTDQPTLHTGRVLRTPEYITFPWDRSPSDRIVGGVR